MTTIFDVLDTGKDGIERSVLATFSTHRRARNYTHKLESEPTVRFDWPDGSRTYDWRYLISPRKVQS